VAVVALRSWRCDGVRGVLVVSFAPEDGAAHAFLQRRLARDGCDPLCFASQGADAPGLPALLLIQDVSCPFSKDKGVRAKRDTALEAAKQIGG